MDAGSLTQVRQRIHCHAAVGGYAQFGEQDFFQQAILCRSQRQHRRCDARARRQSLQRCGRHVFPVDGDHFAVPGHLVQQLRVGEIAKQGGTHLVRRRAGFTIKEQELLSQRVARKRHHAAELAGAQDADGHD